MVHKRLPGGSVMQRAINLNKSFFLLPLPATKLLLLALVLVYLTPALLLCGAGSAFAQEVTASITGTVTDPSGAAVGGATVTAKSGERGLTYAAGTEDSGVYCIRQPPRGNDE